MVEETKSYRPFGRALRRQRLAASDGYPRSAGGWRAVPRLSISSINYISYDMLAKVVTALAQPQ